MFENFSATSAFNWLVVTFGSILAVIVGIVPDAQVSADQINEGLAQLQVGFAGLVAAISAFVSNIFRSFTLADGLRGILGFRS